MKCGRSHVVTLPDGAMLPAELMNKFEDGTRRYRLYRDAAATVGAPWLFVSATGNSTLSRDEAGWIDANGNVNWADPYAEEADPNCWE